MLSEFEEYSQNSLHVKLSATVCDGKTHPLVDNSTGQGMPATISHIATTQEMRNLSKTNYHIPGSPPKENIQKKNVITALMYRFSNKLVCGY